MRLVRSRIRRKLRLTGWQTLGVSLMLVVWNERAPCVDDRILKPIAQLVIHSLPNSPYIESGI